MVLYSLYFGTDEGIKSRESSNLVRHRQGTVEGSLGGEAGGNPSKGSVGRNFH